MRPNTVKQLWREDKPTFGAWLTCGSTLVAEELGTAGFDWLLVDGEHSPADTQTIVYMLQAISIGKSIPMARVPWNDPVWIKRVLDGGAYGVVIPNVNSRAEAEQAVDACRYPPVGQRGYGPYRGWLYGGRDYAEHANDEIACIISIETPQAVEEVDAIVSVAGVDAAMVGPGDLAVSMGIAPQWNNPHPDHVAACNTVLEACKKHGVVAGIFTSGAEEAVQRAAAGWRFLPLGVDTQYLMRAAFRDLRAARKGSS